MNFTEDNSIKLTTSNVAGSKIHGTAYEETDDYIQSLRPTNEVKLVKIENGGTERIGNYVGLYFAFDGKELYYYLSDSVLYELILVHLSKCVIGGLGEKNIGK